VLTSAGFERGGVMVGAALHERGLFFDGSGDAVGLYPTQGDIMDSRSLSLFASGELDLTDTTTVSLLFNDFDLERNGDFRSVAGDRALGIPTGTEKGDPSALVGDPARTEATNLSLTLREGNLFGGALEAQLYGQRFRALFEGGTFGDFFRLTPDGRQGRRPPHMEPHRRRARPGRHRRPRLVPG